MKLNAARMVIFKSVDGDEPWDPVLVNDVPDWLKEHGTMAELHSGKMARSYKDGIPQGNWYRAEQVELH